MATSWLATCLVSNAMAAVTVPGAVSSGPTAASETISLAFVLPSRDPLGAREFVTHVSTPGDKLYRHYLTPDDYATRFGASEADYESVVAWARARGLTVGERYSARTVVPVSGRTTSVEAALGIRFRDFRTPDGRVFYAADGYARLPPEISGKVGAVIGLSSSTKFAPQSVLLPVGSHTSVSGSGPGGAFSAADLRSIYSVPSLPFGEQSQTLAVFEQGGFAASDVATYLKKNKLRNVPALLRSVDGYGGGVNDPGVELEAVLDIDMLIAMNPAAKRILVYEDGADSFQVALLDSLSAMATDDSASTISISYGEDEALQGGDAIAAENTVLTQMAAQGQAVFASSGDDGAFGNGTNLLNVSDPASQPMVTGVGGTTLFNGPNGLLVQEVWNDLASGAGAGGGGISTVWPLPAYQQLGGKSVAKQNGGSSKFRNVPDVSLVANPLTGVAVYSSLNGGWRIIGGTSVSAPLWAGFYSLSSAASEAFGLGRPGFANPVLYQIGEGFGIFGQAGLTDVLDGNNGVFDKRKLIGYSAGFGYDDASGYGSLFGELTLPNLVLAGASGGSNPPHPPEGLDATTTATTATVNWSGVKSATGYLVSIQNATSGALTFKLATSDTVTFTGLAPSTTFAFAVASVSPGGTAQSEASTFVTLGRGRH